MQATKEVNISTPNGGHKLATLLQEGWRINGHGSDGRVLLSKTLPPVRINAQLPWSKKRGVR